MSAGALYRANPAATLAGGVTTAQLFANRQTPALPATINVLGAGRLEQQLWKVRGSGSVTTGTTATITPTLYVAKVIPGTPFTAANWTLLGAGTAVSLASITAPWEIDSDLMFESIGGTLQGTFKSLINNSATASAAITNRLTGLNGTSNTITQPGSVVVVAAEPVFYIAVGLTFSAANAGNSATLGDFSLLPAGS
jgi:hypothetical protein